jgi:mannose-6-phosphate isomerase-like protein (cupin superfamily)
MVMSVQAGDTAITAMWDDTELFRYTFVPDDPQVESPRPYFHPVRTLGGDVVTIYRPHDHVWHKGITLSLPHLGTENFWGGPTFRNGGYVQLANDGTMRHDAFDLAANKGGAVRLDERLSWITEAGQTPVTERRRVAATAWPEEGAWVLAFETTLTNVGGEPIAIGSPTTEGRPNAGYGGLFWRGPRSFTGGHVVMPDADGGDELMGRRGPWLAYTGRHDGHGRASTLVFRDARENFSFPSQWFVRSTPFAAVCPAPFFDTEYPFQPGSSLTLRYDIAVADGALDAAACARLTARAAADDPLSAWDLSMSERTGAPVPDQLPPAPGARFPGATALTLLDVYDWETADGLRGGSAHVHLASAEGYIVLSGTGRLQTLGAHGYAQTELCPGDCLWFTPGTIHRLVNDGDLRLLVVMQNAGLPEHGDAVLTFPPRILADAGAYARAASLDGGPPDERARQRRDLALEGYFALRDQVAAAGPAALDAFFAAAVKLASGHVPDWRNRWREGAMATAAQTGVHLDEIAAGVTGHLAEAGLWRMERPTTDRAYGMCGRLTTYPPAQAVRAG